LIDSTAGLTEQRVLCTSLGRAQFAAAYVRDRAAATVCCHFLDAYLATRAEQFSRDGQSRLTIACRADFPPGEFDLVAIPTSSDGDKELTRDLLQSGHERLVMGGRLAASTDNPSDKWLHQELRQLFVKVTRQSGPGGSVYQATKTASLRKRKNFVCEFAFRDGQRLIHAVSRPGVFSHRHLDLGARSLIEAMEVPAGGRVLDLGCGAGVVTFAAALRAPDVRVTALDANARAIECTRRGAELNQLPNVTTLLNADADAGTPSEFDLVVANPPYFSRFRIGELFLSGAERALRSGGILQLVTKQPGAYLERLPAGLCDATVQPVRTYWVIRAVRR
jgi:16S rRNA (guanine1207-N2)-methyltransferase